MTNNLLEVRGLRKKVGNFQLDNINLSLEKGTIMGLIGRNGAGKTTLVKSVLSNMPMSQGEILFDGKPMAGNEESVKENIGIVFDSTIYPTNMKPKYIIKMFSPFYRKYDQNRFDQLMERFQLDPNKRLVNYSKGMQMKFSVVMAICHNPDLIILDEPTAGLDPVARADVLDLLLEEMQDENKSVVISTHITSDLEKIADYITLIDDGRIIFSKNKDELLDHYVLVNVEKSIMTDELAKKIFALKETAFGYMGLSSNKEIISGIDGIKTSRPTIEEIMIYSRGMEGESCV